MNDPCVVIFAIQSHVSRSGLMYWIIDWSSGYPLFVPRWSHRMDVSMRNIPMVLFRFHSPPKLSFASTFPYVNEGEEAPHSAYWLHSQLHLYVPPRSAIVEVWPTRKSEGDPTRNLDSDSPNQNIVTTDKYIMKPSIIHDYRRQALTCSYCCLCCLCFCLDSCQFEYSPSHSPFTVWDEVQNASSSRK